MNQKGDGMDSVYKGMGRIVVLSAWVLAAAGCATPPLLEQAPSSVPLVENKGDIIFEGSIGLNDEDFVLQGHVTWAFGDHMAVRAGRVEFADATLRHQVREEDEQGTVIITEERESYSQNEWDLALGGFWSSDDERRIVELYAGVADGKAAGGYGSTKRFKVHGDYYRSYIDLNAVWKLGHSGRWLVGTTGRLSHYDPYNLRYRNGGSFAGTTRTMLEPSIFTGFRVGGFQIIGQYVNAVYLGGDKDNYEVAEGVAAVRAQWRFGR